VSGDLAAKAWSEAQCDVVAALRSRAATHDRIYELAGQSVAEARQRLAEWERPTYAQQAAAERELADQIEALTVPGELTS
jgi:hypothetical protein